jgi:hypothetical protein
MPMWSKWAWVRISARISPVSARVRSPLRRESPGRGDAGIDDRQAVVRLDEVPVRVRVLDAVDRASDVALDTRRE